MLQYVQYVGQFQSFRGRVQRLPGWARFILFILAVPGILLLSLSILAGLVSISALLLLTVPAYRFLTAVLVGRPLQTEVATQNDFVSSPPSGRRHIDVKIVE